MFAFTSTVQSEFYADFQAKCAGATSHLNRAKYLNSLIKKMIRHTLKSNLRLSAERNNHFFF